MVALRQCRRIRWQGRRYYGGGRVFAFMAVHKEPADLAHGLRGRSLDAAPPVRV